MFKTMKRWKTYRRFLHASTLLVVFIYLVQFTWVHIFVETSVQKADFLKWHTNYSISLNRYRAVYPNLHDENNTRSRSTQTNLSIYVGMDAIFRTINSRTEVWAFNYSNFNISAPFFITEKSKTLFYKNEANREFISLQPKAALRGEIFLVKNGTYSKGFDCGYRSNVTFVLKNRSVEKVDWYKKLAPFLTPEAWTFQHFLDGALPKIIQALPILQDQDIKIMFQRPPRDKIIYEILERLKIARERVVFREPTSFGAEYFYFTCITPPIQPTLWQTARRLLGAPETLNVLPKDAFIIYVTRYGCHNCGRIVQNGHELVAMLKQRYGEHIVKNFNGGLNLNDTIDLFGKARVVLGSHGGGMYNINFAPINTTVIEFMPTKQDGTMLAASKMIIWTQANLLGQIYWRVCSSPVDDRTGDMIVDLEEVAAILEIADKSLK